jgi:hypothetical protein
LGDEHFQALASAIQLCLGKVREALACHEFLASFLIYRNVWCPDVKEDKQWSSRVSCVSKKKPVDETVRILNLRRGMLNALLISNTTA